MQLGETILLAKGEGGEAPKQGRCLGDCAAAGLAGLGETCGAVRARAGATPELTAHFRGREGPVQR